ncbi:MAG: hypothetical protein IPL38_12015 [Rhodobacter sp.]|nr:hypothetical protein [Rhodobacter sp.]
MEFRPCESPPLILAPSPPPAFAQCPGGTEVFSCPAGKKIIEVCTLNGAVTYSYGPKGKPDISLSVPLQNADYTPWPGVGRAIWDSMAFHNEGYIYEVWASYDKLDQNAVWEGGVNVLKGEALQAQVSCNKGQRRGRSVGADRRQGGHRPVLEHQQLRLANRPCP